MGDRDGGGLRGALRLSAILIYSMQDGPSCAIFDLNGRLLMAEPKTIFDVEPDEALEARLDAEAEAAYEAGRVVPHDKVVEWLESWGKPDELPAPTP